MKRIFVHTILLMLMLGYSWQAEAKQEAATGQDTVQHKGFLAKYDRTDGSYLKKYKFGDNWYLGGRVGATYSMSENSRFSSFFKELGPSVEIDAAKFFYPSFGMRISAGYQWQMSRANWELSEANLYLLNADETKAPNPFGDYRFSLFTLYVDGIVNLMNLFIPYKEERRFDISLVLGLGYIRTFGFDKERMAQWTSGYPNLYTDTDGQRIGPLDYKYEVDADGGNFFAGRMGLLFNWKLTDAWDLQAEFDVCGTDDRYNGHNYNRIYDAYLNLSLGVAYHFKSSQDDRRFTYTKSPENEVRAVINKKMVQVQDSIDGLEPVYRDSAVYEEQLQTMVTFYIDRYYITDAQKKNVANVAAYLEKNPDVDLTVTGFADVETAYPAYNLRLSKKRAKAVYDMLVNEFGVDSARLTMDFKGDVVQPYKEVNEWNRAVTFIQHRRVAAPDTIATENGQTIETTNWLPDAQLAQIVEYPDTVEDVLFNADSTMLIRYPMARAGEYVIPASVREIAPKAFAGCKRLTKVICSDEMTLIADSAFAGCWSLSEIVLPKRLDTIAAHAFDGCILQQVNLPATTRYIGDNAFCHSSLVEVNVVSRAIPELGKNVFGEEDIILMRVNVPRGMAAEYKKHKEWKRFARITETHSYWQKDK